MKNYFSLDEVIKASIEEAFMNARDMFPVAVVKDDICKKLWIILWLPNLFVLEKRKNRNRI